MPDRHTRLARLTLLACLTAVVSASGCAPGESDGADREVRVAAAASLEFAMAGIVEEFEAEYPDTDVSVSYGSSGTLVQQLSNGAPFDVFLSADTDYATDVVEAGRAEDDAVFDYAVGRLVVWVPTDSPADPSQGLSTLVEKRVERVAIANPEHAPYGAAAQAALESNGIAGDVEDKLVLGENIAQAAEFAHSGNADVAVIALSLAVSPSMNADGEYGEVPAEDHPRLDQAGVVLSDAAHPAAAHDLADFLRSGDGQAVLEEHGFAPPGEEG
ncbi:molybdate ABC transporter substrate-binding protein [Halostreptopolyspora alba]|uniref:Molybdate ABC transporter substrate-binding protein n=1 Tax=Halostreptopolyspora alba TaxID=2487137 RepID=A0A3N0E1G7_9ACTN|nr:molybdate ABC transporter substrate-binding protein [Nocardiopsaceae bacterium YIM 96095]